MNLKKNILLAVGVMLLFSLVACNKKVNIPENDTHSLDIVGTVGDENILASEFKYYINLEKTMMEEDAGIADKSIEEKKKFWSTKEGDTDRKQALIDRTFKNLTELKILLMAAKKDNVELLQDESDGIARSIEDYIENEGNGNREEAEKAMYAENGVSLDEYKRMYEEYTLGYFNYSMSQPSRIEISDSELKEEYEKNKDNYNKVTVKHVLVSTWDNITRQPLANDKVAEKERLAEQILQKAESGEDFESLVEQYSEDGGSKDTGGEYTFGKGEMVPEFEKWAFSAKEGDIGIVKTDYGFHIIKYIKNATFEDQIHGIRITLQRQRFSENIEELKREYQLVKNQKAIDSLNLFY